MAIRTVVNPRLADLTPPISGEKLFALGDIGPAELIKGEIVPMSPTGHLHGLVEINIGGLLRQFVQQHKLGRVMGGEVGLYTRRNPDTVRAADVLFISHERLAQMQSTSYLDVAPELIVEILSPDDAWSVLMEKLEEYFSIGVQLVWLVDPRRQQVFVYRSLTNVEQLTVEQELSGAPVLPDLRIEVAELFAAE